MLSGDKNEKNEKCLLVRQYEQRETAELRSGHERVERFELELELAALSARIVVLVQLQSERVDDVDDAVGGGGEAGPLRAQVLLPTHVPQLDVPASDAHRLHVAAERRDRREAGAELHAIQDGYTSGTRNTVQ